jgi:light-regulated signal transduction histidine kinase (bacteriophytochrome)
MTVLCSSTGSAPDVDGAQYVRAILNVLEDYAAEKQHLEATYTALLNILDDVDVERRKAEMINAELLGEVLVRRRAESALEKLTADLARSNAELETFAYVASHDLQEPLRTVRMYTQLLAKRCRGGVDAEADEFIDFIIDGTARMRSLIQDLLAYSRVGARNPEVAPTDCMDVLEQVLRTLRPRIVESAATVTYDLLPTVLVEPVQLVQLFQNLVENALKFSGDAPPCVHVSAEPAGEGWCRLAVSDRGIGIAPEHRERVFQMFQRLHRRECSGTGVGLAICKKIVEGHGGRIWVEPTPGEGTSFIFTLPGGARARQRPR